jgi:hypothetical protein
MGDLPPPGTYHLASQYLLGEGRLERRETTVNIYLSDVGERTIDVECSLPDFGWGKAWWYLPLAFLPKTDVAPDLEVTYCNGQIVPVPTKQQNLALTRQAVNELIDADKLKISPKPLRAVYGRKIKDAQVRRFIEEVITDVPVAARGRRLYFEQLPERSSDLIRLLRMLEDRFVLWVPIEGEPLSHHHFRIRRQEISHQDEIVALKRKEVEWEIPTPLVPLYLKGLSAKGPPWIRPKAILNRLPNTLAVRPLEAVAIDSEANRAGSCHVRVKSPPGFLVRNIRAGALKPKPPSVPASEAPSGVIEIEPPGYPDIEEIKPRDPNVVIQGWDQNLAHVHLFGKQNPEEVYCRITLGPRGGAISLWMMTAVFTAILLWIVHHQFKIGSPLLPGHFKLTSFGLSERGGRHLALGDNEKQIAAAVLLVGPAFASAWSLRAEGGELLRSFLAGARLLLLISAAVSVGAALALAGLVPPGIDDYKAIEIYAGMSYLLAMPMIAAWLLSRDSVWIAFRFVFDKELRNLVTAVVLALSVVIVGRWNSLPDGVAGSMVALCGLGLALIGANSAGQPLRLDRKGNLYRTLAGFGAIPVVALAGSFLGFYAGFLSVGAARICCVVVGISIILSALLGQIIQELLMTEEGARDTTKVQI